MINLGLSHASQNVEVPRVWFFPKTRLNRTLHRLDCYTDELRSGKFDVFKVYRPSGESRIGKLTYDGYYPTFELSTNPDEEVVRAIAPYVKFKR